VENLFIFTLLEGRAPNCAHGFPFRRFKSDPGFFETGMSVQSHFLVPSGLLSSPEKDPHLSSPFSIRIRPQDGIFLVVPFFFHAVSPKTLFFFLPFLLWVTAREDENSLPPVPSFSVLSHTDPTTILFFFPCRDGESPNRPVALSFFYYFAPQVAIKGKNFYLLYGPIDRPGVFAVSLVTISSLSSFSPSQQAVEAPIFIFS